jgi:hypothetical protein
MGPPSQERRLECGQPEGLRPLFLSTLSVTQRTESDSTTVTSVRPACHTRVEGGSNVSRVKKLASMIWPAIFSNVVGPAESIQPLLWV